MTFRTVMPDSSQVDESEALPDRVADALLKWRTATVEKERESARLFLTFKAKLTERKPTSDELKAMVRTDDEYFRLAMEEVKAESEYERLYERLMFIKRQMAQRSAF